jgi:hypothetical protein
VHKYTLWLLALLHFALLANAWAAGSLNASPTSVGFGAVAAGYGSANSEVTLTATGGTVTVTGFTPAGQCGEFSASATVNGQPVSDANPAMLGNGASLTVDVGYQPFTRGLDSCTYTVSQNGSTTCAFQLTGTGVAPVISVVPSTLSFANQRWNGGTPQTLNLTINNTSTDTGQTLDVSNASLTGTQFVIDATLPLYISPGGSAALPVTFNPDSAGEKSTTVTISSNDPLHSDKMVDLLGTGTQSVQTFDESPFDVGSAELGDPAVNTLLIGNTGTAILNLFGAPSALEITGNAASEFMFTDHGCDGEQSCNPTPSSVALSSSTAFTLRCVPAAEGLRVASLVVRSDDPGSPRNVELDCVGLADRIFKGGFEIAN